MDNVSWTSSLLALFLMISALAALPWVLRRWQQRQQGLHGADSVSTKVLSAVAIGPGQRVVTVEVGQGTEKTRLVLGVTAQHIQCLHVLGQPATAQPATAQPAAASFAGVMAQVQDGTASTTTTAQP